MGIKVLSKGSIGHNMNNILAYLNDEIRAEISGNRTDRQKIWAALKGEEEYYNPLYIQADYRLWVRGDGARYKELKCFRTNEFQALKRNIKGVVRSFKTKDDVMAFCWDKIITAKNAKRLGKLSSEFGSSDFDECYRIGKMVFIKRDWGIDFASTSILRNTWVWRLQK